jgi:hypothetical protein
MNRIKTAVPDAGKSLSLKPVTKKEADVAYYECGMFVGSKWENTGPTPEAYKVLWPLTKDETDTGAAVHIVKAASLGLPYCAKGSNPEALEACLGNVKYLIHSWKDNAAAKYRLAMENQPILVTFQGKTKTDVYPRAKIEDQKLRFYTVMPGHLKLLLSRVTQPFGKAKRTLFDVIDGDHDVANFHSAQKIGMTQDGPQHIMQSLDVQLRTHGYAYLHCGDDAIFCYFHDDASLEGDTRLVMFKVDASNYDLTQRFDLTSEVDNRIAQGLSMIDRNLAELWQAIFATRLVNIHMSGVVKMTGIGASGSLLQSEKNDMLMNVCCQRFAQKLQATPWNTRHKLEATQAAKHAWKKLTGRDEFYEHRHVSRWEYEESLPVRGGVEGQKFAGKSYKNTPAEVGKIIESVASGLGLSVRLENLVTSNPVYHPHGAVFKTVIESAPEGFPFLGYRIVPATRLQKGTGNPIVDLAKAVMSRDTKEAMDLTDKLFHEAQPGNGEFPLFTAIASLDRFALSMQYARKGWVKDREEYEAYNEQRIASTMLSLGGHAHTMWAEPRKELDTMVYADLDEKRLKRKLPQTESEAFMDNEDLKVPVTLQEMQAASAKLFSPLERQRRRQPIKVAVEALDDIMNRPEVGSWADIEEASTLLPEERWLQDVGEPRTVEKIELGLRPITLANWGKPPPNKAVRDNFRPDRPAPGGGGSTATKKRRAKRRAKRGMGFDEESTQRYFEEEREKEKEEEDFREFLGHMARGSRNRASGGEDRY